MYVRARIGLPWRTILLSLTAVLRSLAASQDLVVGVSQLTTVIDG